MLFSGLVVLIRRSLRSDEELIKNVFSVMARQPDRASLTNNEQNALDPSLWTQEQRQLMIGGPSSETSRLSTSKLDASENLGFRASDLILSPQNTLPSSLPFSPEEGGGETEAEREGAGERDGKWQPKTPRQKAISRAEAKGEVGMGRGMDEGGRAESGGRNQSIPLEIDWGKALSGTPGTVSSLTGAVGQANLMRKSLSQTTDPADRMEMGEESASVGSSRRPGAGEGSWNQTADGIRWNVPTPGQVHELLCI